MAYHKFVPVPVIDTVFILTAIFAAVSAFVGIKKLWNGMKAQAGDAPSSGSLVGDIIASVTTILAHSKFADCNVNRLRQWGHMALCSMRLPGLPWSRPGRSSISTGGSSSV